MPEQALGGIPLGLGLVVKINLLYIHVKVIVNIQLIFRNAITLFTTAQNMRHHSDYALIIHVNINFISTGGGGVWLKATHEQSTTLAIPPPTSMKLGKIFVITLPSVTLEQLVDSYQVEDHMVSSISQLLIFLEHSCKWHNTVSVLSLS